MIVENAHLISSICPHTLKLRKQLSRTNLKISICPKCNVQNVATVRPVTLIHILRNKGFVGRRMLKSGHQPKGGGFVEKRVLLELMRMKWVNLYIGMKRIKYTGLDIRYTHVTANFVI